MDAFSRIGNGMASGNHKRLVDPQSAKSCQDHPYGDNNSTRRTAHRMAALSGFACPPAAFREDGVRNESDRQRDADGNQNKIVKKTDNRQEIRDKVNRAEGVSDNGGNEGFCVPGGPRVPGGEVKGKGLDLEIPGSLFQFFKGHSKSSR